MGVLAKACSVVLCSVLAKALGGKGTDLTARSIIPLCPTVK